MTSFIRCKNSAGYSFMQLRNSNIKTENPTLKPYLLYIHKIYFDFRIDLLPVSPSVVWRFIWSSFVLNAESAGSMLSCPISQLSPPQMAQLAQTALITDLRRKVLSESARQKIVMWILWIEMMLVVGCINKGKYIKLRFLFNGGC